MLFPLLLAASLSISSSSSGLPSDASALVQTKSWPAAPQMDLFAGAAAKEALETLQDSASRQELVDYFTGRKEADLEEEEEEGAQGMERLAEGRSRDPKGKLLYDFVPGAQSLGSYNVSYGVEVDKMGAMVKTKLGAILGTVGDHHYSFLGIPYSEPPRRFELSRKLKPWAPKIYNASSYRAPCMGTGYKTFESEDCLKLNMWVPKGGHKSMPVIIYFHGGLNTHGSGVNPARTGVGIVNSTKYPSIFITLDWRLGIYGFLVLGGFPRNLGIRDQQLALRWVQENIEVFGGDPRRVTLQGESEGCASILTHMVAPGSARLFSQVALHSPVANFLSERSSLKRSKAIISKVGCHRHEDWSTFRCLQKLHAEPLSGQDWDTDLMVKEPGSQDWLNNMWNFVVYMLMSGEGKSNSSNANHIMASLGWQAVVDNETLFGQPNELIQQGKFHNVSVLMTVGKNETNGILPTALGRAVTPLILQHWLLGNYVYARELYNATLEASGIIETNFTKLHYQMIGDKLFTCDMRALASDFTRAGSQVYFALHDFRPMFAPRGRKANWHCGAGLAFCHNDEILYILPQQGKHAIPANLTNDTAFSKVYSGAFLAFVHGNSTGHDFVPYNETTEPITFYTENGGRAVNGYRKEQCDVLDQFNGHALPKHMRERRHS